jgi:hypothetical protein
METKMAKWTKEEELKILMDSIAAHERGDFAEETRLSRLLPLAPHLAKVAKELYGKQILIDNGYDLSLANEKFGEGWLDR